MNEEVDQIEKNETWELVPKTKDNNIIGTKWVFKSKIQSGWSSDEEQGNISM